MKSRVVAVAVPMLTVAVLALGGCGSSSTPSASGPSGSASPTAPSSPAGSGPTLSVASTGLGRILVDSAGRTVYYYDKDTVGETTSACTGPCVGLWPAVPAPAEPKVGPGVEGTLGTVRGPDGNSQLTLDGHPLYTFVSDQKPGDTAGQGYDGIWWVVDGHGAKVTTPASSSSMSSSPSSSPSSSSSSSGGGGGYGGGY